MQRGYNEMKREREREIERDIEIGRERDVSSKQ